MIAVSDSLDQSGGAIQSVGVTRRNVFLYLSNIAEEHSLQWPPVRSKWPVDPISRQEEGACKGSRKIDGAIYYFNLKYFKYESCASISLL